MKFKKLNKAMNTALIATGAFALGAATIVGIDAAHGSKAVNAAPLPSSLKAYHVSLTAGDGPAVFNGMSQRCQKARGLESIVGQTHRFAAIYGDTPNVVFDQIAIRGNKAHVNGIYEDPDLNEPEGRNWKFEDGQWKWDNCA